VCRDESRQQVIEWLVVVDPDASLACLLVFVDVDLAEEHLIEEPTHVVVGLHASRVTIAGQVQSTGDINVGPRYGLAATTPGWLGMVDAERPAGTPLPVACILLRGWILWLDGRERVRMRTTMTGDFLPSRWEPRMDLLPVILGLGSIALGTILNKQWAGVLLLACGALLAGYGAFALEDGAFTGSWILGVLLISACIYGLMAAGVIAWGMIDDLLNPPE
jgi:hypothetical protein